MISKPLRKGLDAPVQAGSFRGTGEVMAMVISLVVGFLLFLGLAPQVLPMPIAGIVASAAPLGTAFFIYHFKRGKPKGHVAELLGDAVHHIKDRRASTSGRTLPPNLWLPSDEDAFIIGNQIVYLTSGSLFVTTLYRVQMRDLTFLALPEREHYQRAAQAIIRCVHPGEGLATRHTADRGRIPAALVHYHTETKEHTMPNWVKEVRQRNLIDLDQRLENGDLSSLQTEIAFTLRVNLDRRNTQAFPSVIDALRPRIDQFSQLLTENLSNLGASVSTLNKQSVFESYFKFWNRSAHDPSSLELVPHLSLQENAILGSGIPLKRPDHGLYSNGTFYGVILMGSPPTSTFIGLAAAQPVSQDSQIINDVAVLNPQKRLAYLESQCRKLEANFAENRNPRIGATIERYREEISLLASDEIVPCEYRRTTIIQASSLEQLQQAKAANVNAILKMNGARPYEPGSATGASRYIYGSAPGHPPYRDSYLNLDDIHVADLIFQSGSNTGDLDNPEAIFDGI